MTARTPGPWYASGVDIMVAHADSVRNAVANTTCAGSMTREEDEANAAFIVEACNSHARLTRERDEAVGLLRRLAESTTEGKRRAKMYDHGVVGEIRFVPSVIAGVESDARAFLSRLDAKGGAL